MKKTLSIAMALTLGMSLVSGVFAVDTDLDSILFGSSKKAEMEKEEVVKPQIDRASLDKKLAEIKRKEHVLSKDMDERVEIIKQYCVLAKEVDTLKSDLERLEKAKMVAKGLEEQQTLEAKTFDADGEQVTLKAVTLPLVLKKDKEERKAEVARLMDLAADVKVQGKDTVLRVEHKEMYTFAGKKLVSTKTTYGEAFKELVKSLEEKWDALAEATGKYQTSLKEVKRLSEITDEQHAEKQKEYHLKKLYEAEYAKLVAEYKLDPQLYKGCPARLIKHPADVKAEEMKKDEMKKKDNVPNTASAAASASLAFAAIFAAAAAVVAKRK